MTNVLIYLGIALMVMLFLTIYIRYIDGTQDPEDGCAYGVVIFILGIFWPIAIPILTIAMILGISRKE